MRTSLSVGGNIDIALLLLLLLCFHLNYFKYQQIKKNLPISKQHLGFTIFKSYFVCAILR